ncbi:MAG: hypothetical protein J6W35_06960 [Eubacterium sp.]|nr:hypothetical protein [Eubacterium sp.]
MNKYKCDNFTTYSLTEMSGYILDQCSPEDIITTWYKMSEGKPALYDSDCDYPIGNFCLSDLLIMYRNNILADKIYDWAFDFVDNWLEDEIERYANSSMPMIDISVNINNFHIRITWED